MADFKIKLTTAGKAALVDDANIGTEALKIRKIEIGSSFYDPTGSEENLKNFIKSLDTFGASPGKDGIIHISIRDEAEETYNVGEIGLRTGTGVLFAVISNAEGILTTKGLNDVLLISADLEIIEADVSNVSFGPANFIYQPATEEKEGILEIASDDEMDAGEKFKAVDADKFQSAITRRSSSKIDLNDANKLATSAAIFALSQLIETNNNSISAINSLLQSDNADLDKLQEIVDYIETIKGTQDTLAISNIALLQDALNGKSDNHTHPYAAKDDVLTAVPVNAKFTDTNTWRGISDSLSSESSVISASSKAVRDVAKKASDSVQYGFAHGGISIFKVDWGGSYYDAIPVSPSRNGIGVITCAYAQLPRKPIVIVTGLDPYVSASVDNVTTTSFKVHLYNVSTKAAVDSDFNLVIQG